MPEDIVSRLNKAGIVQEEFTCLESALADTDVLYMTRMQKERFNWTLLTIVDLDHRFREQGLLQRLRGGFVQG